MLLSRKTAVSPTSSAELILLRGAFSSYVFRKEEKSLTLFDDTVFIGPAEIELTHKLSLPRSAAKYLTDASNAALATPITL